MPEGVFTLDEISKHNNKHSPWLLIHGKVYNVSEFLDEHPGGEEVLLEQAGSHATEAFEDIGHSTDAQELMKKYLIGELCEEDKKKIDEIQPKRQLSMSSLDESSWKSWMIPVCVAVLVSLAYRFYLGLNA